jgi:hypoxanthine phosphoribosyltransferase
MTTSKAAIGPQTQAQAVQLSEERSSRPASVSPVAAALEGVVRNPAASLYSPPTMMRSHIDRIILSRDQISRRVDELARQITVDLSPPNVPFGSRLTILPVMTGAMVFCADLVRQMPLQLRIATIRVSSYPGAATSSQGAKVVEAQLDGLADSYVVLVDDILDSGNTLRALVPMIQSYRPIEVKTCVLLRKKRPEAMATPVDYVGFDIPDEFVVGYGLDYDDYYRNLPDIVNLKPEIIASGNGK